PWAYTRHHKRGRGHGGRPSGKPWPLRPGAIASPAPPRATRVPGGSRTAAQERACPVSIIFRCRRCDRRLSLDRRQAGQAVSCPRCKTPWRVPAEGAAPPFSRLGLLGPLIAVPLVILVIAVGLLLRPARAGTGPVRDPDPVAAAQPADETASENPPRRS